ncbi:MAG: ketoacyl-ACP synthase III [Oligoflexales bacterium]|nr:ketoacyl-ACP synthase III [Oligoflexales bacterium]
MAQFRRSQIRGVGHYVPEKIYRNDDLSKMMDTSDEWIRERTGIQQRHIASIEEGTSDLGTKAAEEALRKSQTKIEDIDLILAATLSPDYFFPGIGVLIQRNLGKKTIPAIDLRGQCSGFSWGLATADAYIKSGIYKKVLVVGAEVHSRVIEFSNRGRDVSVLFGDAGGAAVVEGVDCTYDEMPRVDNKQRGMIDHEMGSDGTGAEQLAILRPGMKGGEASFITGTEAENKAYLPVMDGRFVFKNAVSRMLEAVSKILKRNELTPQDIDLLVPHQANIRINEMVRQKLEIAPDKVFNNIHKYGNTTSATLPMCLSEAEAEGRLKKGDLIMTVAFGSGFTWGANLIRW